VSLVSLGMLREGSPPRPPLHAADQRSEAASGKCTWAPTLLARVISDPEPIHGNRGVRAFLRQARDRLLPAPPRRGKPRWASSPCASGLGR